MEKKRSKNDKKNLFKKKKLKQSKSNKRKIDDF